jgi:predicted alpha/beta superfamily hydrolase
MHTEFIRTHELHIDELDRTRTVTVYLPHDYVESGEWYPVVYMHDGQNLFFDDTAFGGHSWGLTRHWNGPGQPQVIVVGIHNGGEFRFQEYSPYPGDARAEQLILKNRAKYGLKPEVPSHFGGAGDAYLAWIVDELKPFIDQTYRTSAEPSKTAIIGSSMGGLISFYAGLRYSDVFGCVGILSPAFWFGTEHALAALRQQSFHAKQVVYMTVGTAEYGIGNPEDYIGDYTRIEAELAQSNCQLYTAIIEGGTHNERTWEQQMAHFAGQFLGL